MKKFAIYFFSFVFICFFLPSFLTKQDKQTANFDVKSNLNEKENENTILNIENNIKNSNEVNIGENKRKV